jgi:hypothetical protein
MTDGDLFTIAVVALAIGFWLWEHPAAARGIGMVVLFGLVCFGVAHAQANGRRHQRRGYYGRGDHRCHHGHRR